MPNNAEADVSLEFLDSRHCNFMAMQKMSNEEQKRKPWMRRWNRRWSLTSCPSAKSHLSKQLIKSEGNFWEKKKKSLWGTVLTWSLAQLHSFLYNSCRTGYLTWQTARIHSWVFLGAVLLTGWWPLRCVSKAVLSSLLPWGSWSCSEINTQDLVLMEIILELGKNGREKCLYLFLPSACHWCVTD